MNTIQAVATHRDEVIAAECGAHWAAGLPMQAQQAMSCNNVETLKSFCKLAASPAYKLYAGKSGEIFLAVAKARLEEIYRLEMRAV